MDYNKKAIALHKKYRGKIEIRSKVALNTKDDLSLAYTPGVGGVCLEIKKDPKLSFELTNRANQVAIVTDGTAILGLGNIGPEAGMPVMEGKAVILKEFAGIDAIPLAINTAEVEDIVKFVKWLEPSFAGINLEDISAPRCFEITERLEMELSIPVFHDDQDGTAIVVLAALINACRATGKTIEKLKIVINGAGAAGLAIARLLLSAGIKDLVIVDSEGTLYDGRWNMNKYKQEIAKATNKQRIKGWKEEALAGADVFIGVSLSKQLTGRIIKTMAKDPLIFPLANPEPEIFPNEAYAAGAAIVGTGRSDFPNQINNALVFPGVFKGLLENKIRKISTNMKLQAAKAIADCVTDPTKNKIMPEITEKSVVKAVAGAIR